jgi:transcriptional regulator with XRE-family HTH domain
LEYKKEFYEALGNLRKTRKSEGLSQKQLASLAGVEASVLAKIELGAVDVSLEILCSIAKALNKKVEINFR